MIGPEEAAQLERFLAGRVDFDDQGFEIIPPVVAELVSEALASPTVHEEIPYLNDDWIKVAGFKAGRMDVSVDGTALVPVVIQDLVRLGLRMRQI